MLKDSQAAGFRFPLLAGRVFDTPLLIHERKLRVIVGALGSAMEISGFLSPEILASANDSFLSGKQPAVDPSGYSIAVIPIHGTLVHRSGGVDALSGLRSYESVRQDLDDAINDSSVAAILFDIDSGGGEAAGCFDLVDEIYRARTMKPVYAFVNEHAYSGAYAIASAAEKIYIPRTGGVGSIGVVSVHLDQSGHNAKLGFAYTPIYAGAHKIDGWPHSEISESARAEFQSDINQIYKIFTETVARNRGINLSDVVGTEARCFMGSAAIDAGLADEIATMDDVINAIMLDLDDDQGGQDMTGYKGRAVVTGPDGVVLNEDDSMKKFKIGKGRAGVTKPSTETETEDEKNMQGDENDPAAEGGDVPPAEDEDDKAPATEGGDAPEDDENDPAAESDDEDEGDGENAPAVAAANANAARIVDMCALYGDPVRAAAFIRKGMSASEVSKKLLSEKRGGHQASHRPISSAHSARTGRGGPNPGERLADQMAERHKVHK